MAIEIRRIPTLEGQSAQTFLDVITKNFKALKKVYHVQESNIKIAREVDKKSKDAEPYSAL